MHKINSIKSSNADLWFNNINYILMIIFCITTLYPFVYLLTLSFIPSEFPLTTIYIIPPGISFDNYKRVFASEYIRMGFGNTILRTLLGTFIQLFAILCTAYPLSKRYYPNRNFWTGLIVFTMFFNGGLIPTYLLIKTLNLTDSVWALILPGLIPSFTMIIVRNFFMALPESLEESARIDGANDIVILFLIIIPVSLPIIATVILWQAVGHWNAWFDCLIYINKPEKQVLQIVVRRIVLQGTQDMIQFDNASMDDKAVLSPDSIKAATIMITTVPIIMIYPFLQKYFVKGVMVGSLKG